MTRAEFLSTGDKMVDTELGTPLAGLFLISGLMPWKSRGAATVTVHLILRCHSRSAQQAVECV